MLILCFVGELIKTVCRNTHFFTCESPNNAYDVVNRYKALWANENVNVLDCITDYLFEI